MQLYYYGLEEFYLIAAIDAAEENDDVIAPIKPLSFVDCGFSSPRTLRSLSFSSYCLISLARPNSMRSVVGEIYSLHKVQYYKKHNLTILITNDGNTFAQSLLFLKHSRHDENID